jgi:glycosyltransferase involved in cell wall biosynthesis
MATRRVLLIAYAFPPTGGAGVQRTAKFVKYLPQHGWLPSVLTVRNPSVPVSDASLARDIPAETVVRRARTWEPGYGVKAAVSAGEEDTRDLALARRGKALVRGMAKAMLQPDPQILWVPAAVREGRRWLAEVPHAAVMATAPPFSSFLAGLALARHARLPLVLDYRDEWSLSGQHEENKRHGRLAAALQDRMQRAAVRGARAVIATTRASAAALAEMCQRAGSDARVLHIYNGFDPDDFLETAEPEPARAAYRVVYTGTLWKMTTCAPLVEAVLELSSRSPELAARLELVFAGRRVRSEDTLLARLQDRGAHVIQLPYVDHSQALTLLRAASCNCLLQAGFTGGERVVSAKLFEYLAARRPILAVAPRGEVWDLLADRPQAHCFEPRDVSGIAGWLAGELRGHGPVPPGPLASGDIARFSRVREAGELAALLDTIAG